MSGLLMPCFHAPAMDVAFIQSGPQMKRDGHAAGIPGPPIALRSFDLPSIRRLMYMTGQSSSRAGRPYRSHGDRFVVRGLACHSERWGMDCMPSAVHRHSACLPGGNSQIMQGERTNRGA